MCCVYNTSFFCLYQYIFSFLKHIIGMILLTVLLMLLTLTLAPLYFRVGAVVNFSDLSADIKVRLWRITLLQEHFELKGNNVVYNGTLDGIAPIDLTPNEEGANLVRCFDVYKIHYRIVFAVDKPSSMLPMFVNVLSAISTAVTASLSEVSIRGGTSFSYDKNVTVAECLIGTTLFRVVSTLIVQGVKKWITE